MQELIQKAKEIIEKRYKEGCHVVGAAVRTKSGKIYSGISINSQKLNVCAEWSPIGQAFSEGDSEIDMVVAVRRHEKGRMEIYPPCGLCRELYITYCPKAKIIISDTEMVDAEKLLPSPWKKRP